MRRRLLAAILLLVVAPCSAVVAAPAPVATTVDGGQSRPLVCDASRDERARLAAMLASGGAFAGGTLRLESGCKVLLGSPGAGRAALVLSSGTRIECADPSAGFVLARESCRGGALPGAACSLANHDADCPDGGRCTRDVPEGAFAPEEDAVYTVIGSEPGAVGTTVSGCGIWVNGVSGDSVATGGSGARYGFCSGGAAHGFSCWQACSAESGRVAGFACTRDSDCTAIAPGGRCVAEQCGAQSGACATPPPATSWGPSGKGFIHPVDLGGAFGATVENVRIHDHRKGQFAIRVGSGVRGVDHVGSRQRNATSHGLSTVRGCTTDAATVWETPSGILTEVYEPRPFVEVGIVAGEFDSAVCDNHVAATRVGIRAYSSSLVTGNVVNLPPTVEAGASPVDDSVRGEGLPRGIGLLASGHQSIFADNLVSAYVGFLLEPGRGFNVTVADNRFFSGAGPKIAIPGGSGAIVRGNYLAWGSSDNLACSARGEPLACCDGPGSGHCTGPGVVRIGDGDRRARAGSTDHVDVVGNFLQSDQPYASYLVFDGTGARCAKGDRALAACTADADCPDIGACTGSGQPRPCCTGPGSGSCRARCRPAEYDSTFVSGNHFYRGAPGQTAIDLSRLAPAATTASRMSVSGNTASGFARGVLLPADASSVEQLAFVGNDFSGTAASELCTGEATPMPCCRGLGAGECPVYDGWRWTMGERSADAGLTPFDEQVVVVTLQGATGDDIRARDVVADSSTTGGTERATRTADAAGVALADATAGAPVRVAVSGLASCKVSGAVARAARLAIGARPGELEVARNGQSFAIALAPAADGELVRCLLAPRS